MHTRELLLISDWKELEYDLTHNYQRRIEIHEYLLRGQYPDFPAESRNVYWNFFDIWDDIYFSCTPAMAKNIEVAFFVEWEPLSEGDRGRKHKQDELPLSQILKMPHSGVWALVACCLSPESVNKIAEVTGNFDLDSYLMHFEPSSPPDNFPDKQKFELYSQIWLGLFNLAADHNCGVVILDK